LVFPYKPPREPTYPSYKRRRGDPHNTHHFGEEEEKGGFHLLELLYRVG
jgi:hypothetical protein